MLGHPISRAINNGGAKQDMCWGILAVESLTKEELNKILLGHHSSRAVNKGGAEQDTVGAS